jgi:hypothetical protein
MTTREQLIAWARTDPVGLRDALRHAEVEKTLSDIGVLPKVLELHAPSPDARKREGLGQTLCGINGTRHRMVTCERCKKRLAS